MINKEDVFQIGRLGKTHGVKGEITMQVDDDVFDRVDAEYLVLEIDGILVPFFMEEYRFRSDTVALVKFCDIDTQQRAQELTGCDVYFPRTLADDDDEAVSFSMLVGFDLINAATNLSVGRIDSIDDSTANVLFCLDNGLLLPANDDLLERIDVKQRQIVMNIPEGLLDLNV